MNAVIEETLRYIDSRMAKESGKDDSLTRGYLLALRHVKEHIESELAQEPQESVA